MVGVVALVDRLAEVVSHEARVIHNAHLLTVRTSLYDYTAFALSGTGEGAVAPGRSRQGGAKQPHQNCL